MKILLIILLFTIGCRDISDNYVDAKVHPVWYNTLSSEWTPHEEVEIKRVHKGFSIGDYVEIRGRMYLIVDIESEPGLLRDYQIELHFDTIWVYDRDRLVSRYISDYSGKIDSIFMEDNR